MSFNAIADVLYCFGSSRSSLLTVLFFLSADVFAKGLTLGIVPQHSPEVLAKKWVPICAYLSQETGLDVRYATAPSIPAFERKLAEGKYDLAYINPYHFVVFNKKPGYRALARAEAQDIHGIIVVPKESTVTDLKDLHGKQVAFPSASAFAASMIPQGEMRRLGIDVDPYYVVSHDSVYRSVEKGLFVAGGGVIHTLEAMESSIRSKLRVLWKSKGYTPHAFVYHPRVSKENASQVRDAFVKMRYTDHGKRLLKLIKRKGLVAAGDKDWDDVRSLGIHAVR